MGNKKIVFGNCVVLFLLIVVLGGCEQKEVETPPMQEEISAAEEKLPPQNKIPDVEKLPRETVMVRVRGLPEETPAPEADGYRQDIGTQVTWYFDTEWKPSLTLPSCSAPLTLQTPVDINLATSLIYPGQVRGGHYKAHGGFRFDNSNADDIIVHAPLGGLVVSGSRYFEQGELQYMFDVIHPCGMMYRFDHLYTLSPKFAAIAEEFRQPVEGDSRGTKVNPVSVEADEIIATAVGLKSNKNVFVDWGVYDLRQKNKAAQDPAWLAEHSGDQAPYALCWLDMLSPGDVAIVKRLPGSGETKQSDYCK